MIQTPRPAQQSSEMGFYLTLAALWLVTGLVLALAAILAGGTPHTHIVEWPYVALRDLVLVRGRIEPWQWVGAPAVRSSAIFYVVLVLVTVPLLAAVLAGALVLRGGIPAFFPFLSQPVLRSRWASAVGLGRAGILANGPDGRRLIL